jgi:hypothetical protein
VRTAARALAADILDDVFMAGRVGDAALTRLQTAPDPVCDELHDLVKELRKEEEDL